MTCRAVGPSSYCCVNCWFRFNISQVSKISVYNILIGKYLLHFSLKLLYEWQINCFYAVGSNYYFLFPHSTQVYFRLTFNYVFRVNYTNGSFNTSSLYAIGIVHSSKMSSYTAAMPKPRKMFEENHLKRHKAMSKRSVYYGYEV